ncbi:alpha/beta hydrolase [Celeribacter baekdonensis]|uniref:AB hydrolase-1 domain-containing protein n=1 Tax=Celeribacter baekdonensis B30 TaxID=1208323 RepID=K2JGK9_9RHOB|nr:alpha/beta fold hydrolase [Celeribacter baekdonensis]EKE74298.1 hypothetical protein B30_01190 [Celeribacter baekdonensis B30]
MTRLLPALTSSALCLLATSAFATETLVTVPSDGGKVVATLNDADGASDTPVILLFHGFTGSRDELPVAGTDEGVFSRSARVLAEAGYPSLRIDFLGSGASTDKTWEETTFSGQIADGLAAVAWLNAKFPDRPQVILGWSQGGLVASHVAEKSDPEGLILWAPVADPLPTYSGLLGTDAVVAAIASEDPTETFTFTLPWGATTSLNAPFFDELVTTDPVAAVAGYDGPLLLMVGANDTIVGPQPQMGERYANCHPGETVMKIYPMDHSFNVFTDASTLDQMLAETVTWLGEM